MAESGHQNTTRPETAFKVIGGRLFQLISSNYQSETKKWLGKGLDFSMKSSSFVFWKEIIRNGVYDHSSPWIHEGPVSIPNGCLLGLLKKAASGVLAIFPCSRTGSTLCAQK
ncbi:MAG: hypothetical protein H6750_05910 [Nitrospiraceae bacterium]|nr:hypothetical protein [Nitrospiraceae bacterium]